MRRRLGALLCTFVLCACTESNPDYTRQQASGDGFISMDVLSDGGTNGRFEPDALTPDGSVSLTDRGLSSSDMSTSSIDGSSPPADMASVPDAGRGDDSGGESDAGIVIDGDGDGVNPPLDCDDDESSVFPGAPERCDGLDNDCDLAIDEQWPQLGDACTSGLGACLTRGTSECSADEAGVECSASPGDTSPEVCDQVDNDCDGTVDEDVADCCAAGESRMCGSDVGECVGGRQVCLPDGRFGACLDQILPAPDVCNGLDDDCDGDTDETFAIGEPCVVSINGCDLGAGRYRCTPAGGRECLLIGDPPQEVCNGQDDDCDGRTDEGLLNACGECGLVEVEVCNNIDDDCDGDVDEELLNACGACGVVPSEVCNDIDDDCDGDIDEELLNACGACGAVPPEVCNDVDDDCDGDIDEEQLNACGGCGAVPPEVCNGQDDDCDGDIDEELLNACGRCGEIPAEVCNGLDDDCDGQVDEVDAVCVTYAGSVRGPERGFDVGHEMITVGDLTGDGVDEALVSGRDGDRGVVVAIDGVGQNILWQQFDDGPLGVSLAVLGADDPENVAILAGAPRGDGGAIHRFDGNGDEVEVYAGDDNFRLGEAMATHPDFPGAILGDSNYNDRRGSFLVSVGDNSPFVSGLAAGDRLGERVYLIPDLDGDGVPDIISTTRFGQGIFAGRGTVYFPSRNWQDRSGVLSPILRNTSFAESIVWGNFLDPNGWNFAYGTPEYGTLGRANTGGVFMVSQNGNILGTALSGQDVGGKTGRRMGTYRRPNEGLDWLVVGGEAMARVELWRLENGLVGPQIAQRIPVTMEEAERSFGRSLAFSRRTADGRTLLYVGEPESGNRGRVHMFWVR